MKSEFRVLLAAFGLLSLIAGATPPNTTAANAVPYEVDQGWVTHQFDDTTTQRWFSYGEVAGRSYCIEAVQGALSPVMIDPSISVFSDASGTAAYVPQHPQVALVNNDGGGEPNFRKGARVCYVAPGTGSAVNVRTFRVSVAVGTGDSGLVRIRVVETSLYAQCTNLAGVNSMAANLTNTTGAAVTAFTHFESPNGSGNGKYTAYLAAFQTNIVPVYPRGVITPQADEGVCVVSHAAPPGAITAEVRVPDADNTGFRRIPMRQRAAL